MKSSRTPAAAQKSQAAPDRAKQRESALPRWDAEGGTSALGAALTRIGVPRDQVIKYETALKVDKYVLMVHGDAEDVVKARILLANAKALETV